MAVHDSDLVVGRKSIMQFLKITNWESVERLITKRQCPVTKLEGRWVARREKLIRWLDIQTGDMPEPPKEKEKQSTEKMLATRERLRNIDMEKFLVLYREHRCLVRRTCKHVGIDRKTYYNWRNKYDRFDMGCVNIEKEVLGCAKSDDK